MGDAGSNPAGSFGSSTPALTLFVLEPTKVSTHRLEVPGSVVIGRALDADVQVESSSVSRYHARIEARMAGDALELEVEDLASRNGVRLRGERITPQTRHGVGIGQAIQIGTSCLVTIHRPQDTTKRRSSMETTGGDPADEANTLDLSIADAPPHEPASYPSRWEAILSSDALSGVVVSSPEMIKIYTLAERAAQSPMPILIFGETGTGKELLARFVHESSRQAGHPFVAVNCGGITASLLESELFGHEKGAFTGATSKHAGLIEAAGEGTLFLDEVAEMPLDMQVKLLRVLENRVIRRVGSVDTLPVRARFICATNRDLEVQVAQGQFRSDLYYRLKGITLEIPALREHASDIPLLISRFLLAAARATKHSGSCRLSNAAMNALCSYEWPGNIRQLKSVVECAFVLAGGGEIGPEHLALPRSPASLVAPSVPDFGPPPSPRPSSSSGSLSTTRSEMMTAPPRSASRFKSSVSGEEERRAILHALEVCAGNQTRAAEMLGISRGTLLNRLDAHNIQRPRKGRNEKT